MNVDKRGEDTTGMKWRYCHKDRSPCGNSRPLCAAGQPRVSMYIGRGIHPCLSPTLYARLFIFSQQINFSTTCTGQKKEADVIYRLVIIFKSID